MSLDLGTFQVHGWNTMKVALSHDVSLCCAMGKRAKQCGIRPPHGLNTYNSTQQEGPAFRIQRCHDFNTAHVGSSRDISLDNHRISSSLLRGTCCGSRVSSAVPGAWPLRSARLLSFGRISSTSTSTRSSAWSWFACAAHFCQLFEWCLPSNRRWQFGQNEPTACFSFFGRCRSIEVSSCDSHQSY